MTTTTRPIYTIRREGSVWVLTHTPVGHIPTRLGTFRSRGGAMICARLLAGRTADVHIATRGAPA